jgi:uncharacterized membrane protein
MKIVCARCEKEGKDADMGEKAPLDNPATTHGLCPEHLLALQAEIEELRKRLDVLHEHADPPIITSSPASAPRQVPPPAPSGRASQDSAMTTMVPAEWGDWVYRRLQRFKERYGEQLSPSERTWLRQALWEVERSIAALARRAMEPPQKTRRRG